MRDLTRRTVLGGVGSTVALGMLAGCLGDDDDDGDDTQDTDDDGDENGDDNGDNGEEQAVVDEWLENVGNYDGSVDDQTGQDEVTIQVGDVDGVDEQLYVYEPAAVRIDAGTNVVWEWAHSGTHSVTDEDGEFDSGTMNQDDSPFEHQFDDAGAFRYFCQPHRGQEHKGALIVK